MSASAVALAASASRVPPAKAAVVAATKAASAGRLFPVLAAVGRPGAATLAAIIFTEFAFSRRTAGAGRKHYVRDIIPGRHFFNQIECHLGIDMRIWVHRVGGPANDCLSFSFLHVVTAAAYKLHSIQHACFWELLLEKSADFVKIAHQGPEKIFIRSVAEVAGIIAAGH